MIKSTFYNLPEEKRGRILNAVLNEFFQSRPEKISINNIVKNSGISRSSFYQYFDDKGDLACLLLNTISDKFADFINSEIKNCGGDFFAFSLHAFDTVIGNTSLYSNKLRLKYLFENMKSYDYRIGSVVTEKPFAEKIMTLENFNTESFGLCKPWQITALLQLILQTLYSSVINAIICGSPPGDERRNLEFKLSVIKTGMTLNSKNTPHNLTAVLSLAGY